MSDSDNADQYISKINWLVQTGREDLIDEIADEFERRPRPGRDAFWSRDLARWPGRRAT